MRSELLLACVSGPLLAVLLLRGRARRQMAALCGGMLIAFFSGFISGYLAGQVDFNAMAAVLYISPVVEEGLKLLLFLLIRFVCQLQDADMTETAVSIGAGFALMESAALIFTGSGLTVSALLARAFCSAMIHVACSLMLIAAVRMVKRMALESFSALLGVYAATVTIHAIYNLLISGDAAAQVIGYALPAALIVGWKLYTNRRHAHRGDEYANQ